MGKEVNQTVIKAFRIIECFSDDEELGITELAKKINAGKTVTERLVASLQEFGYLRQNEGNKKYRLGLRFAYWGNLVQERNELVQVVEPYLKELSRKYNVTAHMAVRDNDEALIVAKVVGGPFVYMDSRVGTTLPIHACATGKCLLAFGDDDSLQAFLKQGALKRFTDHTITDVNRFLEEMDIIRERKYAVDDEESNVGLSCLAIPLFANNGKVAAAISISGQTSFIQKNKDELIASLRSVQQKLF